LNSSCITFGAGGRSTIGDIRISKSMKYESRLGGAASGKTRKRAPQAAILYRRYQNRARWRGPRV